jgi:peptide/nickel transport system permease protein
MLAYIIRRLLYTIPIVMGVLLILFLLFFIYADPLDMAIRAKGEKASPESLEKWIAEHGYDKPKFWNSEEPTNTQLYHHFKSMLTFKFGNSDYDDTPISKRLKRGMGPSLMLTIPSLILYVIISIFLALLVSFFRGTYIDYTGVFLCVLAMSIVYLLYIIAGQFVLAKLLSWFPISGYERGAGAVRFVFLPVLIYVAASIGQNVRFYRTIFLEETNRDYVKTARAKGVTESKIMFKHILKNAMIPIITRVVMAIPFLIMGSLLTEAFFGIPGLGSMTFDAINNNDFATLRVMVYIGSLLYIFGLILTDICYTIVDPRIRLG